MVYNIYKFEGGFVKIYYKTPIMLGVINKPRIARKNLNTTFLHVMVQGVNKEYIFYKQEYIKKYLEIIEENKKERDFEILAYCIMNNHAHFLVHTENIDKFGKFMQKVNLLYAQMYNKKENRCGVLFRNRYKTEAIYDRRYLINCIKYIHNNPVKAQMVLRCEDYKFSSYNDYIKNEGPTRYKSMKEIFGEDCDYAKLFEQSFDKRFMDVEDEQQETINYYILEGIREFKKDYLLDTVEILSSREIFKKLIVFLKENCGLRYTEISKFFEISRGSMDKLKVK